MTELILFIKELGEASVGLFWWPVVIWTGLALIAAVILRYASSLSAVYQYHFRVAVLAALPAGILAAPFIRALPQPGESAGSAALFVIQNPIPVSVTAAATPGFNWIDPSFWIGVATLLTLLIALAALTKLLVHFLRLKVFINKLKDETQPHTHKASNVSVFISGQIDIPCAFGWFDKIVVMPEKLKDQPEKFRMGLRHELTHIHNRDFPVNNFTQCLKALFYFHPLVHHLTKKANEYREIYCDISVLTDARISQKKYAQLLYELSPNSIFKQTTAVNMSVNPSTLKKRIQIMKTQANITPSLKRSVITTLLLGLTLTGFMACSDITNDGLTVNEVKKAQQKAGNTVIKTSIEAALILLNGEKIESNLFDRIDQKYIKSVEVIKGEAAIEAYGKAGKNGVIKVQVYDKELALSDLNPKKMHLDVDYDLKQGEEIYISVENMPKLKNQKAFYTGIEYPEECKQAGIEGTVYVQFVVTKTGEVTNAEVIKGIGGGCDQYALQYVKNNAEFTAGMQNGEPVNVRYTIPIMFKLR